MFKVDTTSRFYRSFKRVPLTIQNDFTRKIEILKKYPFSPTLRTHKLHGRLNTSCAQSLAPLAVARNVRRVPRCWRAARSPRSARPLATTHNSAYATSRPTLPSNASHLTSGGTSHTRRTLSEIWLSFIQDTKNEKRHKIRFLGACNTGSFLFCVCRHTSPNT